MTKKIPLTQGKFALIDDEDYERVAQFKWSATWNAKGWYAKRTGPRPDKKTIYLHRFILNAPSDTIVDHQNINSLDCQRSNLRLCNKSQNASNQHIRSNNTSGYKGVTWDQKTGKWKAQIWINKRCIFLGRFGTAELAAQAYNKAARRHHGRFARLNDV